MPTTWSTSLLVQALFFKAMVRTIIINVLNVFLFIHSLFMLIVNNYLKDTHSDLHAPILHMSLHNFIYYEGGQLLYMSTSC